MRKKAVIFSGILSACGVILILLEGIILQNMAIASSGIGQIDSLDKIKTIGLEKAYVKVYENLVEKEGTLKLITTLGNIDGTMHSELFILENKSKNEFFILENTLNIDTNRIGKKIKIKGNLKNNKLEILSISSIDIAKAEGTIDTNTNDLSTVEGIIVSNNQIVKNIGVYLINLDGLNPVYDKNQAETYIFGDTNSVKEFYHESSYGKILIESDTNSDSQSDIFTGINLTSDGTCSITELNRIYSEALNQVKAQGVDTTKYTNNVMILPKYNTIGCSWAGLAYLQDARSWIAYPTTETVAHELGHNFGVRHASTDSNNDGITESEYGDLSDVMGGNAGSPLKRSFNAAHLDKLNFGEEFLGFQYLMTENNNVFSLVPTQTDPNLIEGTRVVKIQKYDTNNFYYLSYRQAINYDTGLNSTYTKGVSIHVHEGTGYKSTRYIKTLNDGETYTDNKNGIYITQLGTDINGNIQVEVNRDSAPCISSEPSLTINNTTQYANYNEDVIYSINITNNDDLNCKSTNFGLNIEADPILNSSITLNTLLLNPGETGTIYLNMNSYNITNKYSFLVNIQDIDNQNPTHSDVNINGLLITDGISPSVPTNLTSGKSKNKYILNWDISIDNLSGILNYEIFRDSGSGFILYAKSTKNSFTEVNIGTGVFKYYIKAIDKVLNSSIKSNETIIENIKTKGNGNSNPNKGPKK